LDKGKIHVVIGDTQVKEGVPTNHLSWIGQYIVDHFAEWQPDLSIIHTGDHADMPSLSSYDKGKKEMEGRRYKADVRASNNGWDLLNEPLYDYNKKRRKPWEPKRFITLGNHEYRINKACEDTAQLDGVISTDDLNYKEWGWEVIPFLEILDLDGIWYSHYFYNPQTGKPYGGANLYTRLQTIGHSFTMGHQQGLKVASREVGKTRHCGLVLGSTYLHDEKYLGPQGNAYWRGIVVCHQVENGAYDRMEVSLDFLCRRYEGKTLSEFMRGVVAA